MPRIRRKRYRIENLKREEKRKDFKRKISQDLGISVSEEVQDINQEWNLFMNKVKKVAEEVVEVQYRGKTEKRRRPWWTAEVEIAVTAKAKAFRKWMKTRRVQDREESIRSRNECEEIKRRPKDEMWERIGEDLQQDLEGTRIFLYSMAKNYV